MNPTDVDSSLQRLKNYFENEKDEINVPEYLIKITKFSSSSRQAIEYSKIIYDMYVRRELIKISENTIDTAKVSDLNISGQAIIENSEKLYYNVLTLPLHKNLTFDDQSRICKTIQNILQN